MEHLQSQTYLLILLLLRMQDLDFLMAKQCHLDINRKDILMPKMDAFVRVSSLTYQKDMKISKHIMVPWVTKLIIVLIIMQYLHV